MSTLKPLGPKSQGYRPIPIHPDGLRAVGFGAKPVQRYGPGPPPSGFLTQQTTNDEWIVYHSMGKVFTDPDEEHIRLAPFFGGLDWAYQKFQTSLGLSGKTAIDFLVYLPGELIGIRVQTELYHVAVQPEKTAYDVAQFEELSRSITMRDIYSQDFIEDASGESCIRLLIETLGGRSRLPAQARFRRSRIGVR